MSWSQYLFSFSGRVNRSRMWRFYIVAWAIEMALFALILLVYAVLRATGMVGGTAPATAYPGIAMTAVFAVSMLGIYYMYAAVSAKRLHDRGKSAWWIFAFLVGPTALVLAPDILTKTARLSEQSQGGQSAIAGALLAGMAFYLWGFVELYCLRGTAGDNRYGPDPLADRV